MIKELVKRGSSKAFFGVQAFGTVCFLVVLLERRVLEQDSVWRKSSSLGDSFLVGGLVSVLRPCGSFFTGGMMLSAEMVQGRWCALLKFVSSCFA